MTGALRTSAAATLVVGVAVVAGIAVWGETWLGLGAGYPFKAVAAFGVVIIGVLAGVRASHPFARFGAANQLTTIRAAIVALVAALIGEPPEAAIAAAVAVAATGATLLDGVDGWIARRTGMASGFGARFDLETDAALIQVLAVLVWLHDKAGPWIIAAGLLRYVFVAAGWVWDWMRRPLPPSPRGRALCIIQIGALIIAILPTVPRETSRVIAALGLTALSYSFLVDTVWLWHHTTDN